MSMFHVGQLVSAVRDATRNDGAEVNRRSVYVISETYDVLIASGDIIGGVNVAGQPAAYDPDGNLYAWAEELFAPVKDTSIEIFRSLLSPVPEEVA